MGKKSKSRTLVMIIVALVLINIFLMIGSYLVSKNSSQGKENTANPTKVENVGNLSSVTSLEGFVPVEIDLSTNLLLVKNGCKGIAMTPTEQQMRSIASALNNETDFRPSTHDLMYQTFQNFGIEVLQSKIVGVEENEEVYYARLLVKRGDKILNLDSKPSDTIAMALRAKIPIYIKQDILNIRGNNIC